MKGLKVVSLGAIVGWVVFASVAAASAEDVCVNTSLGSVIGSVSPANASVVEFLQVPYMQAPVGDLRFQPPKALKTFPQDPWDARSYGPACPQLQTPVLPVYGENCTWLAIWTPKSALRSAWSGSDVNSRGSSSCWRSRGNAQEKLPVMVFIHGGGFIVGSARQALYNGAALAGRQNVVVVTMQYRLGFLGFSALYSDPVGMLDQVAALQWVHKYIEAFGGDAQRVTLFGESAGSISVWFHLVSPLSQNLFSAAIAESAALTTLKTQREVVPITKQVAHAVNCSAEDLACLRNCSWELLVNKSNFPLLTWYPFLGSESLPAQPVQLLASGNFSRVPLVAGFNRNESNLILAAFYESFTIFEPNPPDFTLEQVVHFLSHNFLNTSGIVASELGEKAHQHGNVRSLGNWSDAVLGRACHIRHSRWRIC